MDLCEFEYIEVVIQVDTKRIELVPAAGVEPATFRSGGERSNPLSYAGNVVEGQKDSTVGHKNGTKGTKSSGNYLACFDAFFVA